MTSSISYVIKLCAVLTAEKKKGNTAAVESTGMPFAHSTTSATTTTTTTTAATSAHRDEVLCGNRDKMVSLCSRRGRLERILQHGLHLRAEYCRRIQAWKAASTTLHEAASALETVVEAVVGEESMQNACLGHCSRVLGEVAHQHADFRRRAALIESHVLAYPRVRALGSPPLSTLLQLDPTADSSVSAARAGAGMTLLSGAHSPAKIASYSTSSSIADSISLVCHELRISPSQDFRCPLLTPRHTHVPGVYLISWDFKLLAHNKLTSSPQEAYSGADDMSSQDIGFCIMAKQADGSFPQLKPYE